MDRHGNKLLITLVLFIVALITLWTPSRAYSSGSHPTITIVGIVQGQVCAAGDPDIGQNVSTPSKTLKRIGRRLSDGGLGISAFGDWVRWTGWIWATLHLRG